MVTYRIEVTYASGGRPQVHRGLEKNIAFVGAGAFLRDLQNLEGRGIKRFTIEAEEEEEEPSGV
jgi:hypothetical protein